MNEALLEYIEHRMKDKELGRVEANTFQGDGYLVNGAVGNNRSA